MVGHWPPVGVSGTTDTNVGWLPERLLTPVTLTSAPTTVGELGTMSVTAGLSESAPRIGTVTTSRAVTGSGPNVGLRES